MNVLSVRDKGSEVTDLSSNWDTALVRMELRKAWCWPAVLMREGMACMVGLMRCVGEEEGDAGSDEEFLRQRGPGRGTAPSVGDGVGVLIAWHWGVYM